jgi:hypothetical protein
MDEQIYEPVEEAPVPLFNGVVLGVRSTDGTLWLAVRDLAVTVDAVPRSQIRRVQTNPLLQRYVRWFRATTAGGSQNQLFLQLEGVGLWLMTISVSRAPAEVRQRLIWLQQHLEQAVRRAFAEATGLPERSSDIEDIDEIGRIDHILQGMVQQQRDFTHDQDALRADVAALTERVLLLEGQRRADVPTITKAQRGQIFHMVVAWAELLQSRNEGMTIGGGRAACWAALKKKFHVAEYSHIPSTRYNEAVTFIREAYAKLGGGDLPIQVGMDLGGDDAE